jgi:hypothetical protein
MLHIPPLFRHPPTHRSKHGTTSCKDISAYSKVRQLCSGGHWGQTRSGVLPRREQAPTVSETRSELRCTTYTDASPPRRLHTASASCDPDEWTKVVRKEPAGPGALWVVGLYVTSGQGLPGSRKAWRAGPVPVWHSRVVRRLGFGPGWERFAKMPYGYAGWYRRPGFGLGWERFAIPPPPPPPPPLPFPVPESPRRRMCQHGFPSPFRPCQMIQEQCQWSSALLKGQATHQSEQVLFQDKQRRQGRYG